MSGFKKQLVPKPKYTGAAKHTSGNLKKDLMKNKHGKLFQKEAFFR